MMTWVCCIFFQFVLKCNRLTLGLIKPSSPSTKELAPTLLQQIASEFEFFSSSHAARIQVYIFFLLSTCGMFAAKLLLFYLHIFTLCFLYFAFYVCICLSSGLNYKFHTCRYIVENEPFSKRHFC